MMYKKLLVAMLGILLLLSAAQTSQAALSAVDPGPYTAATGFFPLWYQDTNGRALELCLSLTASVNGPMCILLPNPGIFDPALPIAFLSNFPDESFWFAADTAIASPSVTIRYTAALEAAFGGGIPAANDQVSFARIRVVANVANPGTYVVTHPYGVEVFEVPVTGSRAFAFTRDIGIGAPGVFTGALKGDIGPFLVRVDPATGLPAPIVIGTETFVGDPNVFDLVTGSPFGTNFLRVQGPGVDLAETHFFVMGKVFAGEAGLPTPVIIDRTTYGTTAAGATQIDVFATSAPTASLAFSAVPTLMGGNAIGRFFGQDTTTSPVPFAAITVSATSPINAPNSATASLTDLVTITRAEYSLTAGTLLIEASSSDEAALPTLTAIGVGTLTLVAPGPLQSGSFGSVIPPATVTVTSVNGGSDTEEVIVLP